MTENWFSIERAAALLGERVDTISSAITTGRLRAEQVDGAWRISPAALDSLLPAPPLRHWQVLIEAAPNAMALLDVERKIAVLNEKAARLFDRAPAELLGVSFELLIHQDGQVMKARRQDGAVVPVELEQTPVRTASGPCTLASLVERRDAEVGFRVLIDAAPQATVVLDRASIVQVANARASDLFGYPGVSWGCASRRWCRTPSGLAMPRSSRTSRVRRPLGPWRRARCGA